ncbi:ABC transporter substrate-binding protein [Micromonospora sp. Llam0]|uniref:ABC transporter substrate-binding protein n=1 Tax=Micromonospora sp. Llam0 TaxID=2485143 RepID=UPI0018F39329|nr:ABC transporter substrate-binding protein [Micromonospora sp. Llam0]
MVALTAAGLLATACGGEPGGADPAPGDFAQVQREARGQTVNLFMYGGDDGANRYIDEVVAPAARQQLDVGINRVPVTDTALAVNKVLGERQAGRASGGSVDLVWINGENFRTGKQAGLWQCGLVEVLPNMRYVDWSDPAVANDFGTPVDGCEVPWSRAQFAFVYDSARVDDPPSTLTSLLDWVRANPGRFTYPAPPDFTGSVFVRHVLAAQSGGRDQVPDGFDQAAYDRLTPPLWQTLRELRPALWREGGTYPANEKELNDLYANRQVDFTMTYGPAQVTSLVERGQFPATTRTLLLDEGTIGNTNYLAVPANAANRPAALTLADLMLSPELQYEKARPGGWGQYPAVDLDKLDVQWRDRFAALPTSPQVPGYAELSRNSQPELRADWLPPLEEGWRREVLQR